MTAYIDLIILENFFMNAIILYTTGTLLNKKINKKKLFISSLIGTIYVFTLCFRLSNMVLNISKFIMGLLLVKICFGSRSYKAIVKETAVYFFSSFIYAGCALGFLHIVKPKVVYIVNGIIIGGEYIFEIVGLSAIVSFVLIKASMKLIKLKSYLNKKNMIADMEIFNNKKSIKIRALVDSGNLLTDPVSHDPVIIVYKEKVRALFDNRILERIDSLIGGEYINEENEYFGLRAIPYTSVGKNDGIIITCRVDKIKLEYQDEVNEIKNVLIGFYNEALSKNDKYSALIGLQLLEGRKESNEHFSNDKSKGKYSVC
ncbi:MAG: sigma-E processing peptidase SpoIIGA [Clostridia bacterium]|nr:sigma-E processing peptidase SpoIIGA [Clostridia bacterium]